MLQSSALAYRPPEEFERIAATPTTSLGATLRFWRHEKIYRTDVNGKPTRADFPDHRLDKSSVGYSLAGGLHQSLPPLHQPDRILEKTRLFEKRKSLTAKCSNAKL